MSAAGACKRVAIAGLALCCASSWARVAPGQGMDDGAAFPSATTDSPPVRSAASAAFDNARLAFERGDYTEALRLFRTARDLSPHPAATFNVGIVLERMGRCREALTEFERVQSASELTEEERRRAEAASQRCERRLGLLIVSAPAATRVRIDGVERCRGSCRAKVDPGRHLVHFEHAGGSQEVWVSVEPGSEARAIGSDIQAPAPSWQGPSALGWAGVGLAGAGILGTVGFGLRTLALKNEYEGSQGEEAEAARESGIQARTLTNVSIGVAALGGVLFLVDALWVSPKGGERSSGSAQPVSRQ